MVRGGLGLAFGTILAALLVLAVGGVFCFGGCRWFRVLLPILGFMAGFAIGAGSLMAVYGRGILAIIVIAAAGLIVGLLVAVAAYLFFSWAIILLGATLGYILGSGIAASLGSESRLISLLAGILAAVLSGIVAIRLNFPKYAVIVLTAAMGSGAIVVGALLLSGQISPGGSPGSLQYAFLQHAVLERMLDQSGMWGISWVLLAASGVAVQLSSSGDREP
jgi:hypothetical protein